MPREGVSASLAEVSFERADLPWQGLGCGHISVTRAKGTAERQQ